MAEHRHHSRVLIAGLVQIGIIGAVGASAQSFVPDVERAVVWLPTAFVAAVIARRAMTDLTLGQLAIAVAVTVATLMGLAYEHDSRPMDVLLATRVVLVVVTAIAGGVAARWIPLPRAAVLGLAAGGAGVGGLLLAVGIASVLVSERGSWVGFMVIGSSTLGIALAVRFVDGMRTRHAALGLGCMFVLFLGARSHAESRSVLAGISGGAILGLIVGGIGGAIGTRLVRRADRRVHVPEIRHIKS